MSVRAGGTARPGTIHLLAVAIKQRRELVAIFGGEEKPVRALFAIEDSAVTAHDLGRVVRWVEAQGEKQKVGGDGGLRQRKLLQLHQHAAGAQARARVGTARVDEA